MQRGHRRFSLAALSFVAASALLSAGFHLPAAEVPGAEPAPHLLPIRITATGGHPVKGVEDGVLYAVDAGEPCRGEGGAAPASAKPAAATAGTGIRLQVELAPCGGEMTATARCRWSIAGTELAGEASANGARATVAVTAPPRTGVYDLLLGCGSGTAGVVPSPQILVPLYATLRTPLATVSPPRSDWYLQACTWGSGFAPGSSETEVLQTMTHRIYRYGMEHWRYGSFPDEVPPGADPDDPLTPSCSGSGESRWCACSWQGLVVPDTPCDFGSCFQFADVLDSMAATLGIGGVTERQIKGAAGQGFLTVPGARSLDPRYTGNVLCRTDADPCFPYLFPVHSIKHKGGLYFDPTFNVVGSDPNAAVGRSIKAWSQTLSAYEFLGTPVVSCRRGTGYGDWHLFSYPDPPPAGGSPCGGGGEREKGATLTGGATFSPLSEDGKAYARQLAADVEVAVTEPGTYRLLGFLAKGEETIAQTDSWRSHGQSSSVLEAGEGRQSTRLVFSGEQIFRAGEDGPYQLQVNLYGGGVLLERRSIASPAYDHRRFGEVGADIVGAEARGIDANANGKYETLRVTAQVLVREAGLYILGVNLSLQGQTVDDTSVGIALEHGPEPQEVALELDGTLMAAHEKAEGAYITLELYDSRLYEIDAQNVPLDVPAKEFE